MFNDVKKHITAFLLIMLIVLSLPEYIHSQEDDDSYSLSTYLGFGYGLFLSELDYEMLSKNGFSGTLRIMWEPEHLLSVGIESGYLQLYRLDDQMVGETPRTFGITSTLNAVPILAVFSMRIIKNLKLSVGTGMYILYSFVDALDNQVTSSQLSTGSCFAANYLFDLSSNFNLGAGIKYNYINKIEDGNLSLQAVIQFKLLNY